MAAEIRSIPSTSVRAPEWRAASEEKVAAFLNRETPIPSSSGTSRYHDSKGYLPEPNSANAQWRTLLEVKETTIGGEKVTVYVHNYFNLDGYKCKIEVARGPESLENWESRTYSKGQDAYGKERCAVDRCLEELSSEMRKIPSPETPKPFNFVPDAINSSEKASHSEPEEDSIFSFIGEKVVAKLTETVLPQTKREGFSSSTPHAMSLSDEHFNTTKGEEIREDFIGRIIDTLVQHGAEKVLGSMGGAVVDLISAEKLGEEPLPDHIIEHLKDNLARRAKNIEKQAFAEKILNEVTTWKKEKLTNGQLKKKFEAYQAEYQRSFGQEALRHEENKSEETTAKKTPPPNPQEDHEEKVKDAAAAGVAALLLIFGALNYEKPGGKGKSPLKQILENLEKLQPKEKNPEKLNLEKAATYVPDKLTNTLGTQVQKAKTLQQKGQDQIKLGQKQASQAKQLRKAMSQTAPGEKVKIDLAGKERNYSQQRAEKIASTLENYSQTNCESGSIKNKAGKVGEGAAKIGKKGTKELKNQARNLGTVGVDALGCTLVNVFTDPSTYEKKPKEVVKQIGKETVKSAAISVGSSVARAAAKEGVKQLTSKTVAQFVPGVGECLTVVGAVKATLGGENIEDALLRGTGSLVQGGINLGAAALTQFLIPVPGVGAAMGTLGGKGINMFLQEVVFSEIMSEETFNSFYSIKNPPTETDRILNQAAVVSTLNRTK